MTGRLRLATVGTGYFSQFHYRAWSRIEDVELVGVCSLERDRADAVAAAFPGARSFCEVAAMLDELQPDFIDVIAPPPAHFEIVEAAARRGINVICQKPFCRDLAEARRACEIAARAGIQVIIHENFRFQPWHRTVRAILDEGRLGTIYQVTFRLRPGDGQGPDAYLDRQPYFRQMPRLLVHETAVHFIDLFQYLLGSTQAVTAVLRRLNPIIAGEDAGIVVFEMSNGAQAVFDGNRLVDHAAANRRRTMGEMLVEGEKGVVRLDGDGRLFERAHGANDEREISFVWRDEDFGGDCVYELQRNAVEALLGRHAPENAVGDYLDTIRITEAIYESSRQGRRIATEPRQAT